MGRNCWWSSEYLEGVGWLTQKFSLSIECNILDRISMSLECPLILSTFKVPNFNCSIFRCWYYHAEDGMENHTIHSCTMTGEFKFLRMTWYPFRWRSLCLRGCSFNQLFLSLAQFTFQLHHFLLQPDDWSPLFFEQATILSFNLCRHFGFLTEHFKSFGVAILIEIIGNRLVTKRWKQRTLMMRWILWTLFRCV